MQSAERPAWVLCVGAASLGHVLEAELRVASSRGIRQGVFCTFDLRMFGLKAPDGEQFVQKRTGLLTNAHQSSTSSIIGFAEGVSRLNVCHYSRCFFRRLHALRRLVPPQICVGLPCTETGPIPAASGEECQALMPKCIGIGGCTGASTKDGRSISTGCTGGGIFGVVPGNGTMLAGRALYFGMAFAVGSICSKSVTSAAWSPGFVDAAADVAGSGEAAADEPGEGVLDEAGPCFGVGELATLFFFQVLNDSSIITICSVRRSCQRFDCHLLQLSVSSILVDCPKLQQ